MATENTLPQTLACPIASEASQSDVNQIPVEPTPLSALASQKQGFPHLTMLPLIEGGECPYGEDFNGLFNLVSSHTFYLQNGGSYTFNQDVSDAIGGYPKNALLWYFHENETPCLVRSLINDNTNNFVNDPTLIDGIHWEKLVNPSSYANTALTNSPYTTNRILEIPQDIKLELNNGTLTLKAGSKVYVPNGFEADGVTPKFDEVVISSDLTNTTTVNSQFAVTVYGNNLAPFLLSKCFSGGSAPTSPAAGTLWYDTANNKMKVYANSSWYERNDCLPIALLTANSSQYTSIDQVFNGFGYIGSTVFALPGVKCQSSTGRNADGTCANLVHTVSSVFTYEAGAWNNATLYFLLWANSCEGQDVRRFTRNKEFSSQSVTYSFDENENKWYFSNNNQTWNNSDLILNIVGKFVIASGKITSFEPYTVDSVLNSNLSNLSAAGQNVIQNIADKSSNPTGTIIVWSAPNPPAGYLVCNGAAISRTTYAALFNVIGTTWGAGDGSTTFNLPNLIDRAPWYSGAVPVGKYGNGSVPNISGTIGYVGNTNGVDVRTGTSGAFSVTSTGGGAYGGGGGRGSLEQGNFSFNASRSSAVYANTDRVIPAFATCLYCIRY